MDKQVRIEIENGHRFVPDVVEAFPEKFSRSA